MECPSRMFLYKKGKCFHLYAEPFYRHDQQSKSLIHTSFYQYRLKFILYSEKFLYIHGNHQRLQYIITKYFLIWKEGGSKGYILKLMKIKS